MSTLDAQDAENMTLGERTRELLRAISDFTSMVAVDAPTSLLSKQIDEMDRMFREIDSLAGAGLYESDMWGTVGELSKIMRLYEILAQRAQDK